MRTVKCSLMGTGCVVLAWAIVSTATAGQELPDELTLTLDIGVEATTCIDTNEGGLEANSYVGTNVAVVLKKRSMRSDNYLCVVWTDDGFKKIDPFPVSTYRGYVTDDPAIRINGNIEPGGILNLNFSEGRSLIARIRNMKIDLPSGDTAGKRTPTMSAGNKVVPLSSVKRRPEISPGGYLIPQVPMRRTKWLVKAYQTYTALDSYETVVSEIEQRWNDGDFVYARDVGVAWEIETMVLIDPKATTRLDLSKLEEPDRLANIKEAGVTGVLVGHNQGKFKLNVRGRFHEARILLHESAHVYGNALHQFGNGDGLCGGGAFWDHYNVAILLDSMKRFNETNFPAVVYGGAIPPRATSDIAHTDRDRPVTIDVLENDYDGNGEAISLQAVQEKSDQGGTVAVKDEKALYTPASGFVGLDRFTYTVVDSAGVANRSGQVKVSVQVDGLAAHFDFDKTEKHHVDELVSQNSTTGDGMLGFYKMWDYRPEEERFVYLLDRQGPYSASRPLVAWIDYAPAVGVKGHCILNPGNLRNATVNLGDLGDPGHGSLSVSLWVCYPADGQGGRVIICKGANPAVVQSGWAIQGGAAGGKFVFGGNTVRMREGWIDPAPPEEVRMANEGFVLTAPEAIKPDQWYHLVMVMDRDKKQLRAWVNSQEVKDPAGRTAIPDGPIEHFSTLTLFNGHGGKWWGGTRAAIDEVKMFTSALTDKQVAELYAEGKDAKVPAFPNLPAPEPKK